MSLEHHEPNDPCETYISPSETLSGTTLFHVFCSCGFSEGDLTTPEAARQVADKHVPNYSLAYDENRYEYFYRMERGAGTNGNMAVPA